MARCTTGELVKAHRLVAGSTQASFAKQAGLSRDQLASIEADRTQPSADVLGRIARAFSAGFLRARAAVAR